MSDAALQHQTAANNRQQLHRLLKEQLRKDKASYIEQVVVETQQAVEAGDTRTFFNKIKQLRPKTKKPLPALRLETDRPLSTYGAIQGACCDHFAQLHSGIVADSDEFIASIRADEVDTWDHLSQDIYAHLPTVSDIQLLCRTAKKGKAGGIDGIPPTYCIILAHGSCTNCMHLLSRCLLQKRSRFNGEAVSLFRFGSDVESKTTSRITGRYG